MRAYCVSTRCMCAWHASVHVVYACLHGVCVCIACVWCASLHGVFMHVCIGVRDGGMCTVHVRAPRGGGGGCGVRVHGGRLCDISFQVTMFKLELFLKITVDVCVTFHSKRMFKLELFLKTSGWKQTICTVRSISRYNFLHA